MSVVPGVPNAHLVTLTAADVATAQVLGLSLAAYAHAKKTMQVTHSLMTASSHSFGGAGSSAPISTGNCLPPDPAQPDTLGWREWVWSPADRMLKSPSQGTLWPEAELVVPHWDEGEAVRGTSGIHAHLVPRHWKILGMHGGGYASPGDPNRVHGIVERFGKFVLGTEGWRAEWVIIRELMAPSTEVGLELEQVYPDVIIHYPDEEGDEECTLEKSSKPGKGNRPTPRPRPSPPVQNSSPASLPSTPTIVNWSQSSPFANWFPSSQQNESQSETTGLDLWALAWGVAVAGIFLGMRWITGG